MKGNTAMTRELESGLDGLISQWGDSPWLYDAYPWRDDAGLRLVVEVIDSLYSSDVLPRTIGGVGVVVQRVSP